MKAGLSELKGKLVSEDTLEVMLMGWIGSFFYVGDE